jgi:hypothetical protein
VGKPSPSVTALPKAGNGTMLIRAFIILRLARSGAHKTVILDNSLSRMSQPLYDRQWIWHPQWNDSPTQTSAGGFVDFRRSVVLTKDISDPIIAHITADTRYSLYINSHLIATGPVKGDQQEWYYDELDLQPFLRVGENKIAVRVLRWVHGSHSAVSFVRMPVPGLFISLPGCEDEAIRAIDTRVDGWEASVDEGARLPVDIKHDDFLHVYEVVDRQIPRTWLPASRHKFMSTFGIAPPWRLKPRPIPTHASRICRFKSINNIISSVPVDQWQSFVQNEQHASLVLPAGSKHHFELETAEHVTAFVHWIFARPGTSGSELRITYAECYENYADGLPYRRDKGNRTDSTKGIYGPHDAYTFGGLQSELPGHYPDEESKEIYSAFHFRTFRVLAVDISVALESELVLEDVRAYTTNYDLQVTASFDCADSDLRKSEFRDMWDVSLRTLRNCMHDTYEDCPFYEQLQYAMDTRSSILFTYYTSGDDRLARLFLKQLHHSFQPALGMLASRAPFHQLQLIPHFSLYWICAVTDHFRFVGDASFTRQFLPVVDAVLEGYARRIDSSLGLVRVLDTDSFWEFVDWVPSWKPFGVPPAARKSGILTYTNCLYAYTLRQVSQMYQQGVTGSVTHDYGERASNVARAVRAKCFDGEFFTDGLATDADPAVDFSVHAQVWAILGGSADSAEASMILSSTVLSASRSNKGPFDAPSIAQSFYTLRALSMAGGSLYNKGFDNFWQPWREQLAMNLTTWVEDNVSQRSDCHAWGSAPLHEYLAEVVGLEPLEPGWKTISFSPRVSLVPELKACVPIKSVLGEALVKVDWATHEASGKTNGTLLIETVSEHFHAEVDIQVSLPNGKQSVFRGCGPHNFTSMVY